MDLKIEASALQRAPKVRRTIFSRRSIELWTLFKKFSSLYLFSLDIKNSTEWR